MKLVRDTLLQLLSVLVFGCPHNGRTHRGLTLNFCHFDNTTCSLVNYCEDQRSLSEVRGKKSTKGIAKKSSKLRVKEGIAKQNMTSQLESYRQVLFNASRSSQRICEKKPTSKEDEERRKQEKAIVKLLDEKEAAGWKKNFASVECGAKLVKSSPSLKHPQHLINKNQDEYMLMECHDQNFFIIELCETIKVMRFELDNFELYSGAARNFTVRTVDKYSNNLKDWVEIGHFEASSDKMDVQNFFDFELKVFGKFIRVDINSYHGSEHFCTMTSFRVFGVSEYEFLHIIDNEAEEPVETESVDEVPVKTESEVENRLHQLEIKKKPEVEVTVVQEHTTIMTYKYLFLQMRNDVCIDSVTLETLTQNSFVGAKDKVQAMKYKSMEKKVIAHEEEKEQAVEKSVDSNDSNTHNMLTPKESILVQISNRVKVLEKNVSSQNNILKTFNSSSKQQENDIGKILDTIVKAKEVFEETAGETENMKGRVKKMDQKMGRMEDILAESAETMKMMMAITIVLAITCLFLVSIICFSPSPHYVMFEEKNEEEEEEEGLSVGNSQPSASTHRVSHTSQVVDDEVETVVTEGPKVKKRVTFTDDEVETEASAEEDISLRISSPKRRVVMRRKDPARRATWCGGSFRRLAEDAAALVAKEF